MDQAEDQYRNLHTKDFTWYPLYKKTCILLLYWYMRKAHINGLCRNVRQLTVLQNKLKTTYDATLTIKEIENELRMTHKKRRDIKKMAESLSLEYRTRLALAK